MRCPFCEATNAQNARACRVCGAPLRAPSQPAPIVMAAPVAQNVVVARRTFDEKTPRIAFAEFFSSGNLSLCLVLENGDFRLWNIETDEISVFSSAKFFRKPNLVSCAALCLQNHAMATGHQNGEVNWRTLQTGKKRRASEIPSHRGRVLALAATKTELFSGASDGVITVTNFPDDPTKPTKTRILFDGLGQMTTLAVSPDGAWLAVGGDDRTIQMWRLEKNAPPKRDWTSQNATPLDTLRFSPNGQMLVSRARDGGLDLWAAQSGYPLPLALAQKSAIAPVFAGDSRLLALVNAHNEVEIFDSWTGDLRHTLPTSRAVRNLAFAPVEDEDSTTLLAIAGERAVEVWEIAL